MLLSFPLVKNQNHNINLKPFENNAKAKTVPDFAFASSNAIKLKPQYLSSKYNINFTSAKKSDFDFNSAAKALEEKISTTINPLDFTSSDMVSAIRTNSDIEFLNSVFQKDEITHFTRTGISLNSSIAYLERKGQVSAFKPKNKKTVKVAFFVDDLALDYLSNSADKQTINKIALAYKKQKLKFYSFNENQSDYIKHKKRLEDILKISVDVDKINSVPQKETRFSKSEDIQTILLEIANNAILSEEEKEKFLKTAIKYLDKTFSPFSYQSLAKNLKEAYKKIEEYAKSIGKSMDEVVYYVPEKRKSYDIIDYLYAKENNIPSNQFVSSDNEVIKAYDADKLFVILDDCSLSGDSMLKALVNYSRIVATTWKAKNSIVFCPILETENAHNEADKIGQIMPLKYIPLNECKTYDSNNYQQEMLLDGFSEEEIKLLTKLIKCGFSRTFMDIAFPYMIPDNCTNLAGLIGDKFLFVSSDSANKALFFHIIAPDNDI